MLTAFKSNRLLHNSVVSPVIYPCK